MSLPNPQVVLGDPLTGRGGDNARASFGKYNVHGHNPARASNFLCSSIRPGDVVEPATACATRSFIQGTAVQQVESSQLTLTDPALRSDEDASLLIGADVYAGLQITKDSRIVKRKSANGFVEAKYLSGLQTEVISGAIANPLATVVYPLVIKTPWAGLLNQVHVQSLAANNTVEILLNGTVIKTFNNLSGLGSHTFTQQISSSTYFGADSTIALRFGSSVDPTAFTYTFYIIKL